MFFFLGAFPSDTCCCCCSYLFVHLNGVALGQPLQLNVSVVGLRLQFLLQPEPVLVHLSLEPILQGDQLLLVLPPHALIPRHLLPQLKVQLMLLDLSDDLRKGEGVV